MKTAHPRFIYAALTLFVALLTILFVQSKSAHAVGIGITDDAPIMGITCGDANAADPARRVCCALPGETRKVTNSDGVAVDENKAFVRAQFQFTETGTAADKPPKKKSIWQKVGGAAGKVAKIGVLTNPATIVASIATGGFGEIATDIMKAAMDVGLPLVSNVARQQADSAMVPFTEAAQLAADNATTVDFQCDTTTSVVDDKDPNNCICKPLGKANLTPGTAFYMDWDTWIAKRVAPEKRANLAMILTAGTAPSVLGANSNTVAQVTDQQRSDYVKGCSEIMDDFERRTCIRQAVAVSPKFLDKCNRIANADEREQCKQCVVGGGQSEFDEHFGENIAGVWTGVGCVPADIGAFIAQKFFPWSLGIGGGVAMLLLMYASFLYTTSRGNPDKLKKARDYMNSALIGLLVIIFAVFLLQLIGVTILRIPGFGGTT